MIAAKILNAQMKPLANLIHRSNNTEGRGMNTRTNSRRKTGLTIKYRTQLDTASKAVTLMTFTSTVYGSMLLFFFSIKHNINFIDLISPGILISAGTLALFMLTLIFTLMIAILYVNKESIQNSFLCLIYINPCKKNTQIQKNNHGIL